jgi:hypothetical protein
MEHKVADHQWIRLVVIQQSTHDAESVHVRGCVECEGLQSRDVYEREICSSSISTVALEEGITH